MGSEVGGHTVDRVNRVSLAPSALLNIVPLAVLEATSDRVALQQLRRVPVHRKQYL